jgi:hypothetical protein
MSETELVNAYLNGKIPAWTFVRRLLKAGVSASAAVAFAAMLPVAAMGGDFGPLEKLVQKTAREHPDQARFLQGLMQHVATDLVRIGAGGHDEPLGRTLARLSLNAANNEVNFADLDFNGKAHNVPINLVGSIENVTPDFPDNNNNNENEQNMLLVFGGNVGRMPVNLNGFVNVNVNGVQGPQGVNLNVGGNVGEMKVNLNTNRNDQR